MVGTSEISGADASELERLKCKMAQILLPFIEEEVSARLKSAHDEDKLQLQHELDHARNLYADLGKKYAALQEEMQRSRLVFEKKCREWRSVKDALSQRSKLKSILNSLEPLSTSSHKGHRVHPQADICLSQDRTVTPSNSPTDLSDGQTKESDPLDFLAEALSTIENDTPNRPIEEGQNMGIAAAQPRDAEERHNHRTPLKRPGLQYIDPRRSKSERKQAHATDCPCCNKVDLCLN